jgi:acetylornithine deacetylase/succinyl-diaminopimelate desuccinylase-like protein
VRIRRGYQPYVILDECTTWIDVRLVPPTAPVDAEKIVEQGITTVQLQKSWLPA